MNPMTPPSDAALALLPCPFCGYEALLRGNDQEGWFVQCARPSSDCFAAMGENYDRDAMPEHMYRHEESALTAWNRRATAQGEDGGLQFVHDPSVPPGVVSARIGGQEVGRIEEAPTSGAGEDAARYRWLRDNCQDVADEYGYAGQLYFGTFAAGTLDAAIDAARGGAK